VLCFRGVFLCLLVWGVCVVCENKRECDFVCVSV